MKTIIIAHNYSSESFAAMSKCLALHLAKSGYKVVFISHRPVFKNNTVDENGVILFSWPEKRPVGFKSLLFYLNLHVKYRPDIVLAHFAAVNWISVVSWFWRTSKRIAYYHTLEEQIRIDKVQNIWSRIKKLRKSMLYSFCSEVVLVSNYAKGDFLNNFTGFHQPKLTVCHNAIPIRNNREDIIKINGKIKLNFLGRLDKSKGIVEFVDRFLKSPYASKFEIGIAGGGELKEYLQSIDNSLINFIGFISYDKVDEYLQSGHYTIITSHIDNLPTVGLESLMNGVPVIGNKRGGIPEIIDDNFSGFIFDGFDQDEIDCLLLKVSELRADKYMELRRNARISYTRKFSMESYISRLKKIIEA